jgi:hypothetical protein
VKRVAVVLLGLAVAAQSYGCSDDDARSCDELSVRIAEIEATAGTGEQAWEDIQNGVALSEERDALLAEVARRNCGDGA